MMLNSSSVAVGSQVFAALVIGLLVAFSLQFLLANFGIALGISILDQPGETQDEEEGDRTSWGETISQMSWAAGTGILLGINLVLGVATFLAVRFSLPQDLISGAVLGITIWSAYFLVLIWISSSTATSLVGIVLGSTLSGLQKIIDTLKFWVQGHLSSPTPLTEERVTEIIRQELQLAFNSVELQKSITDSFSGIAQPKLDLMKLRQEFEVVLSDPEFYEIATSGVLERVDRQRLIQEIQNRIQDTDLEAESILEQLEMAVQNLGGRTPKSNFQSEFLNFLKSASPDELNLQTGLSSILDYSQDLLAQVLQHLDFRAIRRTLLQRWDLSSWDLAKIWQQIQQLKAQLTENNQAEAEIYHPLKADLEDYLLQAYPWMLKSEKGWEEFSQVLCDRQASPSQVRQQLEYISQDDIIHILQQREDLSQVQIEQISHNLEAIRLKLLSIVKSADLQEQIQEIEQQLQEYFQTVDFRELNPELHSLQVLDLIRSLGLEAEAIAEFPQVWNQLNFKSFLHQTDLEPKEMKRIQKKLEKLGDRIFDKLTSEPKNPAISDSTPVLAFLTEYLQNSLGLDRNREEIQEDLLKFLAPSRRLSWSVRQQLANLDWETLQAKLAETQEFSQFQINRTLKLAQEAISQLIKTPRRWLIRNRNHQLSFSENWANFLQFSEPEDLTSEVSLRPLIQSETDLELALNSDYLVDQLSARDDLTLAEAQEVSDRILALLTNLRHNADQNPELEASILRSIETSLTQLNTDTANVQTTLTDLWKNINLDSLLNSDSSPEVVSEQLSQLIQDNVTYWLNSTQDLPESITEQIIERTEAVTNYLQQQVEGVQEKAQNQIESLKQKTLAQVEATRKAVAIAAWWLLGISLTSALTSATAGVLAVRSLYQ